MRKYWLHRISYLANVSYPLLEKSYLSIGFSDFCSEKFLNNIRTESGWSFMEKTMQKEWGNLPRARYFLWRFIAEMKRGDWVIVPSWRTFSIFEIEDDCAILASDSNVQLPNCDWSGKALCRDAETNLIKLEGENDCLDIGFLRSVSIIEKDISRSDFADSALTSRMKYQGTNVDISDLESSINRALLNYKSGKSISLKAEIIEKSIGVWETAIQCNLNPLKYEKLVKWYFERVGASEVIIPPKNYAGKQGDVDVRAVFEKIRTIINVQVKFYSGETSTWAIEQIRDFSKSKESSCDGYIHQFWVISSSDSFSEESENLAKENNIMLVKGRDFIKMLFDVGLESLEEFDK